VSVHIARIRIDGFGPLRGFEISFDRLTVVVGSNESGKSSIVDALHAWLRGSFRRANAVSWDGVRRNLPGYDGSVEVELASGAGAVPAILCDEPLLWNLLVIPEGRAGLRRVGSGQEDWLVEARPHLTGFDAETIRSRVRERAGLTPKDRDTKEWAEQKGQLADRRQAIESFLDGLASLGPREAELRARRAVLARLETAAARERAATDFDMWGRAAAALSAAGAARAELLGLERYEDNDLRRWRGLDVDLAHQAARQLDARRARDRAEEDRRGADDAVRRAESAAADAAQRVASLAGSGLARRVEDTKRVGKPDGDAPRALVPVAASTLVAGVALLAGGFVEPWLAVAGAALAIAGSGLLLLSWRDRSARAEAGDRRSEIIAEALRLGIQADDLPGVERGILEADRTALGARVRLEGARAHAARATERVDELVRETDAAEREFAAVEERIRTVRDRAGVTTIDGLAGRIERKRRVEIERSLAEAELERLLPGRTASQREREVAQHRGEDPGLAPTPGVLGRLESDLAEARATVEKLDRETVGMIERGLLSIGEPDLASARFALDEIRVQEEDRGRMRDAARLALDIVDEADRDVEGHLDRALGDATMGAGAIFSRLTGGRWVGLRRSGAAIEAVAPDGSTVRPEALSRGTHDQLHIALRAALAHRVLGEPAFFVWDDTFLTADPERRRALVAAAVDLVRAGWQILYLTVDPAIADLFAREAGADPPTEYRIVPLPDRSAS